MRLALRIDAAAGIFGGEPAGVVPVVILARIACHVVERAARFGALR